MKATEVTTGLAESNGSLLPGLWRDSLHVICGLTACTPGSAPGPTLGNEYGKLLPGPWQQTCRSGVWRPDGTDRQSDTRQFHRPCSALLCSQYQQDACNTATYLIICCMHCTMPSLPRPACTYIHTTTTPVKRPLFQDNLGSWYTHTHTPV